MKNSIHDRLNAPEIQPADDIRRTLQLFADPSGSIEVRAPKPLNGAGVLVKHFTHEQLDTAVVEIVAADAAGKYRALYCTINPVNPPHGKSASDKDVVRRRRFFVDCDPVKPAGMVDSSATDAEHECCLERARIIREWLTAKGWPDPVLADSSNGGHLIYAIDLPNDEAAKGLIAGCLKSLKRQFSDGAVSVDTSVSNASRITKIYGTVSRKGEHTADRPHRRSRWLEWPSQQVSVPADLLRELAGSETPEQAAIRRCVQLVSNAADGGKHAALNNAAFTLGGYIASGVVREDLARDALRDAIRLKPNVADLDAAFKTIDDGIEAGKSQPTTGNDRKPSGKASPPRAQPGRGEQGEAETGLNPYRGTDDANADLLLGLHGADIRFCPPWDKWLLWTGSHWQIDNRLDIDRLSADVPRSLRTRALERTKDRQSLLDKMAALLAQSATAESGNARQLSLEHGRLAKQQTALGDEVDWLLKLAGKLEGTAKRGCMLLAARHKVVVHHSDLDKGQFLLNAANGTVDLQTGKIRPHERRDLLTHDVEIPYLQNAAAAPTWLQFLNSTFAGDADLIQFVQRAVGYSLTGDVREQVLLICHGVGSNGKSVFLNILQKLLGALAFQAAPDLLMADKQRRHPTEQADLFGKRLVVCQETGEGRRFNETLVKQLTGGDTITARRMHEDFWQFRPSHKLWLSTNHKPEIRGTDFAIWRRIRLIPFNVKFTDDGPARKDPDMEAKLTAELPGILAWAVAGCLDWQRHGLRPPAAVADATAGYQAEMDVLAAWLGECCIVGKRFEAKAADLYATYCAWCEQCGERPETQRKWGMRLTERGFLREQRRAGIVYLGIGVVDHREPCEPCEPEKAIFSPLDFSKTPYGKTAVEGSQGSQGSQSPPVDFAFAGRDVEEF